MLKRSILLVLVIMLAAALVVAASEKKTGEETVKCPVGGEKITKSEAKASYEYKGKTYYFCNDECKEVFVKDPEKYVKNMACTEHASHTPHAHEGEEGTHEAHTQDAHAQEGMVVDPVCGMEFEKEKAKATYEHDGNTYYFCAEKCRDKFAANPGQYVRADDNVVTCPVSGHSFKKSESTASMEYDGKTVYFCCAGCKEKFEKNPEMYVKKKK